MPKRRAPTNKAKPGTVKKGANVKAEAKGRKRKPAEPDVTPAAKSAKQGKGESPSTSAADIKKVKFSGEVPIDEYCKECQTGYHVFREYANVLPPQDCIYNAMLSQTNIGDNNNKYYVLQLLKHDHKLEYVTWFRWGRIGKVTGTDLKRHGANLNAARQLFTKKFREKTGSIWWFRKKFIKNPGKYDLIEMDFGKDDEEKVKKESKKEQKQSKVKVESQLEKSVQDVIDMIFDVNEYEACVKEMEFDVKKAPLGKLTTKQIKAGYESLKEVEECIQKKKLGKELEEACSKFYTRIPHDFGMKRPPLIKTPEELKQKVKLLEALSDIQVAVQLIADDKEKDNVNIKDRYYASLGCELKPLENKDKECKMVKKYVANSHGSTHGQYRLIVEDVFGVKRQNDEDRFKKQIGNRMLLWHGSRLSNWCGILSQGLRIAPPEAPVTGYMFGKGVYFADMVSKSANYCGASHRQPHGFLLLCEVALGRTNEKVHCDYYASNLPKGKSSTKGVGREVPNPKGHTNLSCGTTIPLGKPVSHGAANRVLMYNEYIVYDVAQIRPRYLVKVKFGGYGL